MYRQTDRQLDDKKDDILMNRYVYDYVDRNIDKKKYRQMNT